MRTSITERITDEQKKQFKRLVKDAADKALAETSLDKDGLQKLIKNGDEFQSRIIAAIQELSVSNQFADEETESSYGYLSGYKPKSIAEQLAILCQLFSEFGSAEEQLVGGPFPLNAEGWFAIPRWEKVASTYGEAVQKVLDLIKQTRNGSFHNYHEGQLGPQHLRQSQKSAMAFQKLGDEQKDYDILVVPAQFGLRHRGLSVRRAREVMNAFEFGLGAFAIGIMLLTHPERLQNYDDLWINCAGDEFAPDAGGDFSFAPCFFFSDDQAEFGPNEVGDYRDSYGSASGFLPQ